MRLADVANAADVANDANVADVANVPDVADVANVPDVADVANVANVADVADRQKSTLDTSLALKQYLLLKYCFEAIFIAKVLS